MEDPVLTSFDVDPLPAERGRRFVRDRPSLESQADPEPEPREDVELEPGWEPA